jgi:CubicO group peptidase (beta-lactamase class C family)
VPLGEFLAGYLMPGGPDYSAENFLDARPGALREYSNVGAALAGFVVEEAVGETLPTYTRRHIFDPLGMTDTGWSWSEIAPGARSALFVAQGGMAVPIQPYELVTYPDGGVRTSVADLARFFAALLDGGAYEGARILDPEWAGEMTRFQFTDANRPANYPAEEGNSGLFWRTKFDGTRVGHGGNDPGVAADMLADVSGDIGVVLVTNTSLSGSDFRAYRDIYQALWDYAESLRRRGN